MGGEGGKGGVEVIQMNDTIYPFIVDGDKVVVLEKCNLKPLSVEHHESFTRTRKATSQPLKKASLMKLNPDGGPQEAPK